MEIKLLMVADSEWNWIEVFTNYETFQIQTGQKLNPLHGVLMVLFKPS